MGLASIAVIAAVASASLGNPTPSETYLAQFGVLKEISEDYKVDWKVEWIPCGELNSMYWPTSHQITLCTEVSEEPKVAEFFAAHEMGHAVLMQAVGDGEEESADEFAAIELLKHDRPYAVMGAAFWFLDQKQGRPEGSSHPSNMYRAWNLICLTSGYLDDGNKECRALYLGTKERWESRLRMDRFDGVDL